jgi:hypothetical protein
MSSGTRSAHDSLRERGAAFRLRGAAFVVFRDLSSAPWIGTAHPSATRISASRGDTDSSSPVPVRDRSIPSIMFANFRVRRTLVGIPKLSRVFFRISAGVAAASGDYVIDTVLCIYGGGAICVPLGTARIFTFLRNCPRVDLTVAAMVRRIQCQLRFVSRRAVEAHEDRRAHRLSGGACSMRTGIPLTLGGSFGAGLPPVAHRE